MFALEKGKTRDDAKWDDLKHVSQELGGSHPFQPSINRSSGIVKSLQNGSWLVSSLAYLMLCLVLSQP